METTTTPTRRPGRLMAALALVLAGSAVVACASGADDDALGADDETTTTVDAGGAADADADAVTDEGDATTEDAGAAGSSTGGSNTGGSGGSTGGQPPAAVKPVINAFTTPDSIDCHNGMFQQFTASWKTTNATKVTISIDGPGIYDTYGPVGEVTLPFNCETAHTFLLTAYGADGSTTTKEITLQPRNVQSQGDMGDESM